MHAAQSATLSKEQLKAYGEQVSTQAIQLTRNGQALHAKAYVESTQNPKVILKGYKAIAKTLMDMGQQTLVQQFAASLAPPYHGKVVTLIQAKANVAAAKAMPLEQAWQAALNPATPFSEKDRLKVVVHVMKGVIHSHGNQVANQLLAQLPPDIQQKVVLAIQTPSA